MLLRIPTKILSAPVKLTAAEFKIKSSLCNMIPSEIGNTYGTLSVLFRVENDKTHRACWMVRCQCGKEFTVSGKSLRSGNTASCGCKRTENIRRAVSKHGKSNCPEFNSLGLAIQRCTNPNSPDYPDYGGRGIKVCDRWGKNHNRYNNFLADMGLRPSPNHSLDRIEVDGNYEPNNCKWATPKEQANNRRNKRIEQFSDVQIEQEYCKRRQNCPSSEKTDPFIVSMC